MSVKPLKCPNCCTPPPFTRGGYRLPETDPLVFCDRQCAEFYRDNKTPERTDAEFERASSFIRMQELTMAEIDRQKDIINNPEHYTKHPSGVECITVTEHMSFCLGNVIKYVWRASLKGGIEDLQKARWYIDREIELQQKERARQLRQLRGEHSDP